MPSPLVVAKDYGDPQVRPRLIIVVAKNFVQMPNHPTPTHGEAHHLKPYVKCGDVLEYLRTAEAQSLPNMEKRDAKRVNPVRIFRNNFAPAMLASQSATWHYAEPRYLTVREAATLQSFPLDYAFQGEISDQFRQVGHAVPIEMSRNIARCVRESLRYRYVEEFTNNDIDHVQSTTEQTEEEECSLPRREDFKSLFSLENVVATLL